MRIVGQDGAAGAGVLPRDHELVAPTIIVGILQCRLHERQRAQVREIVPGQSHQHRIVHGGRSRRQIHDTGAVLGDVLDQVRHHAARARCARIRHRGRIVEGREAVDVFEEQRRPVEPLCGACGLVLRQERGAIQIGQLEGQAEADQLDDAQRIDRCPGAKRRDLERRVFGRQRIARHVVIDAVGIGAERVAHVLRQDGERTFGGAAQAEGAQLYIARQRPRAEQLGQRAVGLPTRDIHLEEAVLRVGEALQVYHLTFGAGRDVWNAVAVAHDPAVVARVALAAVRLGVSDRRVLCKNADRQRCHDYQHCADDPPFTLLQHRNPHGFNYPVPIRPSHSREALRASTRSAFTRHLRWSRAIGFAESCVSHGSGQREPIRRRYRNADRRRRAPPAIELGHRNTTDVCGSGRSVASIRRGTLC